MSESGSALKRVITRSLNMDYGLTEIRPLAWVIHMGGSGGWSAEAKSLIDCYNVLLTVYDRIGDALGNERDKDFVKLSSDMNALAQKQIHNDTDDRDAAETEVKVLLDRAKELELLVTERQRAPTLPATAETARALEARTNQLATSAEGLPLEVHEVLFKRKTDVLESVVGNKIADSENPKLAPLKGVPPKEFWRLLIDGDAQGKGDKHCYDRSSGYMAGMMSGLEMVVNRVDDPVTIDFIKDLHKAMSEHVSTEGASNDARRSGVPLKTTSYNSFQEQGLKTAWNGWGTSKKGSAEGREELGEIRTELQDALAAEPEPVITDPYFSVNITSLDGTEVDQINVGDQFVQKDQIQPAVAKLMTHVFTKYQLAIAAAADSVDKKLDAIIDCCRGLGQIHPFKDANGRLIMFGVMSKLLLENGLSPTILSDQGIMIGQSREELRQAITEGQEKLASYH